MSWGVNLIQLVGLTITGFVMQGRGLGFNGNAPFFFNVHGVEHLRTHLAHVETPTVLNESVGQGGFTVIDVGNNREISNVFHIVQKRGLKL